MGVAAGLRIDCRAGAVHVEQLVRRIDDVEGVTNQLMVGTEGTPGYRVDIHADQRRAADGNVGSGATPRTGESCWESFKSFSNLKVTPFLVFRSQ